MILLVGLGNPGADYAGNRHNIGFMAADEIIRRHNFSSYRSKFSGLLTDGTVRNERFLVLKPQTFMNLSGQSVGEAMRFYKLNPKDVVVFHDDLDLVPGKVRVKIGGGHGGHNGLRSIDEHIGQDYRRVRLGIGHPGDKAQVHHHVLGDFAKADREWLEKLLDVLAENIVMLGRGQDQKYLGAINRVMVPPKPKKPAQDETVKLKGSIDGV